MLKNLNNFLFGSALFALLTATAPASADYTMMQWGMDKTTTPYTVGTNINGTWRSLGTVSSVGAWTLSGVAFTSPDANWTTGGTTYHYNAFPFNLASGIPDSAKFGYGYGSIIEGISASVEVPSGSNALHTSAISGYMRTRGAPSGVGLFGACLQSANATNGCWGFNTVTTNGPTVQPVTETGYDFGFLGTELDINLMKKSGGAAPTGNVIGLFLVGASEVQPTGSSDAIRISQLGVGANIKWNTSMLLADGASTYGIWRGTADKTVNNIGSLKDAYVSRNSGGSTLISYLSTDTNGDFYIEPAGTQLRINGGLSVKHNLPATFSDATGAIAGTNGTSIFNTSGTTFFDSYSGAITMRGNAYAAIASFATTGATLSVPLKFTSTAISTTAPTIGSGFGTSPSIVASNGTAAFQVNVGTGGTASSGVITMPAAANGWSCNANDITTVSTSVFLTRQTGSTTTSVTITNYNTAGAATAWVASDKINLSCMAF